MIVKQQKKVKSEMVSVPRLPKAKTYTFDTRDPIVAAIYDPLSKKEQLEVFENSARAYATAYLKKPIMGTVPIEIDEEGLSKAIGKEMEPYKELFFQGLGPQGIVVEMKGSVENIRATLNEIKENGANEKVSEGIQELGKQLTQLELLVTRRKADIRIRGKEAELDVYEILDVSFPDTKFQPVGERKPYDIDAEPAMTSKPIRIEVRDRAMLYPKLLEDSAKKAAAPVFYYINTKIPEQGRYASEQITIEEMGGKWAVLCISSNPVFISQGFKIARTLLRVIEEGGAAELVKEKISDLKEVLQKLNSIPKAVEEAKRLTHGVDKQLEIIGGATVGAVEKIDEVLKAMIGLS